MCFSPSVKVCIYLKILYLIHRKFAVKYIISEMVMTDRNGGEKTAIANPMVILDKLIEIVKIAILYSHERLYIKESEFEGDFHLLVLDEKLVENGCIEACISEKNDIEGQKETFKKFFELILCPLEAEIQRMGFVEAAKALYAFGESVYTEEKEHEEWRNLFRREGIIV